MNVQSRLPTTADEFLRWNEGREGKREFVNGKVVEMMINVTENHYRVAGRLLVQLAIQLDDGDFIVGSADYGVVTRDGVRYPDVMVHRPSNGRSRATREPLLVAEILSALSMADDFGPKAGDYLAIDSLLHYVVLSQTEVAIWLWSRGPGGWEGPVLHSDASDRIRIAGLDAWLDVGKLYSGIAA